MDEIVMDETSERFATDGVVRVRGLIGPGDLEALRAAAARRRETPGPFVQRFGENPDGGCFHSDLHCWRDDEDVARIALRSPIAHVMRRLLASKSLRLLYDQLLIKDPGARSPTPWHHDLPFWPFFGRQIASCWIALDPVDEENGGVHYAPGSHRSAARYRPTQPVNARTRRMKNMDLPECPDLFRRGGATVQAWPLEPGDALIFHALTLHGGRANRSERPRRAWVFRYAGDDVRSVSGEHVLQFPEREALEDGAKLSETRFPSAPGDSAAPWS